MGKNFTETKNLSGRSFTFATECGNDRYGATGLIIKESDNIYYAYASKPATVTVNGGIKSASEGEYKNGKWVKIKDVEVQNGVLTFESGKAYQFII